MASRNKLSPRTRFEVFKRDNFRCVYCGASAEVTDLHVDHRTPVARGGTDDEANLVTACAACNSGKGPVVLTERRLKLPKPRNPLYCYEHRRSLNSDGRMFAARGRRTVYPMLCGVAGCTTYALDVGGKARPARDGVTWGDLEETSNGFLHPDHFLYLDGARWDEIASFIPKPWPEVVVLHDLSQLPDDDVESMGPAGLAERWGCDLATAEAHYARWDWRTP